MSGAVLAAESPVQRLGMALLLPDVLAVMQEEGKVYGNSLAEQYFINDGGNDWQRTVGDIYAPERLAPIFETALEADLDLSESDVQPMLDFFQSPLGRRIVALELSARRALLDDNVEQAAHRKLEDMRAEEAPRLTLLQDYLAANHLIDMNVASALNANIAFMRGLDSTGIFEREISEEEMLAEVWGKEEEVRGQTEDWMMMFAALAYAPLSDADIEAYTEFSRRVPGVALNRALFAGFDAVFEQVSGDLGRAVGRRIQGTSL
jgi:hypothetical protein